MNGCNGRAPFKPEMHVQDGWLHRAVQAGDQLVLQRTARMVDVPFRMAPDCRYTHTDLGQVDKGCEGCRWKVEALEVPNTFKLPGETDDQWLDRITGATVEGKRNG